MPKYNIKPATSLPVPVTPSGELDETTPCLILAYGSII